ncbi:hypothetical protein [Dongia deserti]|nr:hypothetical protein [Dongia deserti]
MQRVDKMFCHIQPARRDCHREKLFDTSFQSILAHGALHGTGFHAG